MKHSRQIIKETIENVVTKKTPLFCYGSLNPKELSEWLEPDSGFFDGTISATLPGHKREFKGYSPRWKGGTVTACPCPNSTIEGFIVFLTPQQLEIIDERELCPWKHTRKSAQLETRKGPMEAQLYVSTSAYHNPPSDQYLRELEDTIRFSNQIY